MLFVVLRIIAVPPRSLLALLPTEDQQASIRLKPIPGGYCNRVQCVLINGKARYAARAHQPTTDYDNHRLAYHLGLAPQPIAYNEEFALISWANSASFSPFDIGGYLQRLHSSGAQFNRKLDLCALAGGGKWPTDLVPSHSDLNPQNCLSLNNALTAIDWDFSTMAPAAWDLAVVAIEHQYDRQDTRRLLRAYADPCANFEATKALASEVISNWYRTRPKNDG